MIALAVAVALGASPVLSLEEALAQAKDRNLDLKVAQARLTQAQLISRRVWAGYLPQLSVGASYQRNNAEAKFALPTRSEIRDVGVPIGAPFDPAQPERGRPTSLVQIPTEFAEVTIQPFDQLGAQAQLQQALIAPALWPAIQSSYLAERVAELNVENARREVLFAVAQLYFGAASLQQAVKVQERLLASHREHEKAARVRVEAGAMPKMALLRAEIDRSRTEQDLKRSQNSLLSAKTALATLLDRDADFEVAGPAEPKLEAQSAELEASVAQRPDVVAAQVNLELAEVQRSGVWLKYLPNVALTGTYRLSNVTGFTGRHDSWAVGVGLNWILWDGGLREVELRETAAKVVEAEAGRRSAELRARDELRRALLDLDSARANRTKATEQVALARENSGLVKVRYESGDGTYLDMSDATAALVAAETGLVAEELNASLAGLKVLKAAGAFNP